MDVKFTSHRTEVINAKDLAMARALEIIGLKAERHAKEEITKLGAVDTGRLRNSITHATSHYSGVGDYGDKEGNQFSDAKANATPKDDEVYIGTNVEYAPHIEFGTFRTEARPYLRPAAANYSEEYKRIVLSELKGK